MSLGLLAVAVFLPSCGQKILVNVDITGDQAFEDVSLRFSAGTATKVWPNAYFSMTEVLPLGLYLPGGLTGMVTLTATAEKDDCVVGTGEASILDVKAQAAEEPVRLIVRGISCIPLPPADAGLPDAGGGTGGTVGGTGGTGVGTGGTVGGTGGRVGGTGGTTGGTGGTVGGTGGTVGGTGGTVGGTGGAVAGTGGTMGGTGGRVGGTGGTVGGTGGAGGAAPNGCGVVHCPATLASCCLGWYSFALDTAALDRAARPDLLTGFTATATSVRGSYSYTTAGQVASVGFDLPSETSLLQIRVSASSTGSVMPIYATFENSASTAGCIYALTLGAFRSVATPTTCWGGYTAGRAAKINIRMDSLSSGAATLTVTDVTMVN